MSEDQWKFVRRGWAVVLVAAAVHLTGAYGLWWLEDRRNPPSCYGIGWGCEPDPGASLFLWSLLVAGPVTVGTLLLVGLTVGFGHEVWRRRTAYGIAALFAVVALVPLLLLGVEQAFG